MPRRFDAVAAQSAAGTLPRAIEVKAIDACTVDGNTQSRIRPVQSSGGSKRGNIALSPRPKAGNSTKVLTNTTMCRRQWLAPASAARGASRAPCRKNSSAIAA